MKITPIDVAVCHAPCLDGFTCKYLINDWITTEPRDPEPLWLPGTYGNNFDMEACRGKHVLMADFSLKRDQLAALGEIAASVLILDHHKTAQADLAEFVIDPNDLEADECPFEFASRNVVAVFDMNKCGSSLVWHYFNGDLKPPRLVEYICDRDLWTFKLPESRAVTAYIRAQPQTFESWAALEAEMQGSKSFERVLERGRFGLQVHQTVVNDIADQHAWAMVDGHRVPMVNATVQFGSDVAHELIQRYPDIPFAAYCYVGPNGFGFGLRSEDSRLDVSEIASRLGGGGHRNASGFRADKIDWCE